MLLPTLLSKLTAQWLGPYRVERQLGKANYLVHMRDRKKRWRVFHTNMLQKWHSPASSVLLAQVAAEEMEPEEIPTWNDAKGGQARISRHLSAKQIKELRQLLAKFGEVFQPLPGHTAIAEHRIMTGEAIPTRLPPYRIPHAYRDDVQHELMEMLDHGVIECSSSDWVSPLVAVKKKDSSLRLCIDYWHLNSLSKTYAYPIP